MTRRPHTSQHVGADGKIVKIPRSFDQIHLDANYHEQIWGQHSTDDHELHGTYQGRDGLIEVRHVARGRTGGPEFELEWEDGMKVSVLDDVTALAYLISHGAAVEDG